MQEIAWLVDLLRIWLDGGTWEEIRSSEGFISLASLAAVVVVTSIMAISLGAAEFRETPLARWFGVDPRDPDEGWAERARDVDKDGSPDF